VNTATCHNCGAAKPVSEYQLPQCSTCGGVREKATADFIVEHPDAPMSDALYAGRLAMLQRAHHAHRSSPDPRGFIAQRGLIPQPPTGGGR
jgi:hypothetical protein